MRASEGQEDNQDSADALALAGITLATAPVLDDPDPRTTVLYT
jgi:hypothetical protein